MKLRLILKSFDSKSLRKISNEINELCSTLECEITGIVALPTRIKKYCVLRSPHIDKDSREHFEVRVHKRVLEIHYDSEVPIFDLLTEIDLAPGVFYRICLS